MQNRYAGDVGDFVKIGLLRAISHGRNLGVIWYRFPDEAHNKDGRHVAYLGQPERFAHLDRDLFDYLARVVVQARTIDSLLPVLGDVKAFDESIDVSDVPHHRRHEWRDEWLSRALEAISDCDVVFADPDNGVVDDADWRKRQVKFGKQMPLREVRAISQGRCALIYHHNTRRAGGHDAEVDYWLSQFGAKSLAIRAPAYSPRTFFVVNPDPTIDDDVRAFCDRWRDLRVRLHSAGAK